LIFDNERQSRIVEKRVDPGSPFAAVTMQAFLEAAHSAGCDRWENINSPLRDTARKDASSPWERFNNFQVQTHATD
jgi:hypothetical protein